MPTYTYPIERGGPRLIEVSWKGFYKKMTVHFGEQQLGIISGRKELKRGKCFILPTGEELCVRLVSNIVASELHLLVNGKPLPGSGSDPWQQLKICAGSLYFFSAVSFLFGVISVMADKEGSTGGYISMGVGMLYVALAWLVSKGYPVALTIAVVLIAVNAILLVTLPLMNDQPPRFGWFVFYILMILPLFRGFAAARAVQAERSEKPFDQV